MSKFSDTLIYLRKRDGLSQQELANRINISRSQIGMYETGQRMPSREVLQTIADIFSVSADFLMGRVNSGGYSEIFRSNLAKIIENSDILDMRATGIDKHEVNLIIDGAVPLTFDCACQLAEQLGETLDSMIRQDRPMLEQEKPTPESKDGLDDVERLLMRYVRDLTQDQQQMLLAQMQVMRESQKESLHPVAQG